MVADIGTSFLAIARLMCAACPLGPDRTGVRQRGLDVLRVPSRPETMTDLELSGRTLGEFLVREPIGGGGHGVVYRCEQRELERDAVVKVLRSRPGDYAGTERFGREARLASQLEHPFSAHVYAFGVEDDGMRWIAMELVRGVTLGAYLKARGPMPLAEFVPFFKHIAEVVHAAHERGIVHRDLKPSNVMVIESGGRLVPKLLDFGISKIFGAAGRADE